MAVSVCATSTFVLMKNNLGKTQLSVRVSLTLSLLMVTVASATFRATGVQSSLLEEPIRLSMAPFSMSIPKQEDSSVI